MFTLSLGLLPAGTGFVDLSGPLERLADGRDAGGGFSQTDQFILTLPQAIALRGKAPAWRLSRGLLAGPSDPDGDAMISRSGSEPARGWTLAFPASLLASLLKECRWLKATAPGMPAAAVVCRLPEGGEAA
ncbi:MAG: hypothetical protein HUK26_06985 [Duodenibacillus sp.]|nr:hypothetical protein [Duodenibacillus sp.]